MEEGLKLNAMAAEDMEILSAACAGAITSPGEMSYSTKSRQFTLTASRFMWEAENAAQSGSKRIRSGLFFADVLTVKNIGIPQGSPTTVMELLSMTTQPGTDGTAEIQLIFAGGSTLALQVECVDASLTDVGASWQTDHIPTHENGDEK